MNWKILYKYVEGSCSEDELHRLGVWLQQNPANEDFFSSFIEAWGEEDKIRFNSDAQAEWEKFYKKNLESKGKVTFIVKPSVKSEKGKKSHPFFKRHGRGIAYWTYSAAAVMLLLLVMFFLIKQINVSGEPTSKEEVTYQQINTVKGQRTNLKLGDGTKVVLNSSSSLRIPENYGKENRTLYLEGEAFFEVEHDEESPFIVVSHKTYTKDLGTQFNVTAYDSSSIEVSVKEGLVLMGRMLEGSPQKEIVELTPNKLGILKDGDGLTVSDIQHIDKFIGWTEGRLVFQSTPFPKVIERLERWFDVEFRIEGEAENLINRTLTASYDNMPMNEVLKVLAISMNISYTRKGRTVTFRSENK